MSTPDFFRSRLDQMIDLRQPLAVLATRLPWAVDLGSLNQAIQSALQITHNPHEHWIAAWILLTESLEFDISRA